MTLKELTVKEGMDFVNQKLRENQGSNRSQVIDKIQNVWHLVGQSYCTMGLAYTYYKAYMLQHNIKFTADNIVETMRRNKDDWNKKGVYFSTSCQDMVNHNALRGQFQAFNKVEDIDNVEDGDYIIFQFSPKQRHIGQKVGREGKNMLLIEWNTSPHGNTSNDPNDGLDGVYLKKRVIDPKIILGYIHW